MWWGVPSLRRKDRGEAMDSGWGEERNSTVVVSWGFEGMGSWIEVGLEIIVTIPMSVSMGCTGSMDGLIDVLEIIDTMPISGSFGCTGSMAGLIDVGLEIVLSTLVSISFDGIDGLGEVPPVEVKLISTSFKS
jgi:hypothetical protein